MYQSGDATMAAAYTAQQYMKDLDNNLRDAFVFVQKNLEKTAEGRKAYYDQNASHK